MLRVERLSKERHNTHIIDLHKHLDFLRNLFKMKKKPNLIGFFTAIHSYSNTFLTAIHSINLPTPKNIFFVGNPHL